MMGIRCKKNDGDKKGCRGFKVEEDGSDAGMCAKLYFDEAAIGPKLIKAINIEEISLLSHRHRCVLPRWAI